MTIRPLDKLTLISSIKKTNRAVIVQETWPVASVGSWLSHLLYTEAFDYFDAPIKVMSTLDCPFPYAKNLEVAMRPNAEQIAAEVMKTL